MGLLEAINSVAYINGNLCLQIKLSRKKLDTAGPAFHEKKEKNLKTNQGGSYKKKLAAKYKKPITRGDKNYNKKKKK